MICLKQWKENTVLSGEARTMLEMVYIIDQQIKYLYSGRVIINNDNTELIRKLNIEMTKATEYVQDNAVAITKIKTIIKKIVVQFQFEYTLSHRAKVKDF